jgi:hypothetical protein
MMSELSYVMAFLWLVVGVYFAYEMHRKHEKTQFAKDHPITGVCVAVFVAILMTLFWIVIIPVKHARDLGDD